MRILTFFLLALSSYALAQDEEVEKRKLPQVDTDYHKYLDDGTKGTSNAFMLSGDMFIPGYVQVTYERKLTQGVSLGLIGGTKLYNGVDILDAIRGTNLHMNDPDGNSLTKNLTKSYLIGGSLRVRPLEFSMFSGSFIIVQSRIRVETFDKPSFEFTRSDLSLGYGYNGRFAPNIKWELTSLVGLRTSQFFGQTFYAEDEFFFQYSLGFNVGFLF